MNWPLVLTPKSFSCYVTQQAPSIPSFKPFPFLTSTSLITWEKSNFNSSGSDLTIVCKYKLSAVHSSLWKYGCHCRSRDKPIQQPRTRSKETKLGAPHQLTKTRSNFLEYFLYSLWPNCKNFLQKLITRSNEYANTRISEQWALISSFHLCLQYMELSFFFLYKEQQENEN